MLPPSHVRPRCVIDGVTYAAYVTALGPPEAIQWAELPDPRPTRQQVLVRTLAVAVNHVDTYVRSGRWQTEVRWPLVVGRDLVGEVVAAPAGSAYGVGQHVWTSSLGYDGRPGATAELVAVDLDRCYPLPDELPAVEAVATFHGATTALLALRRCRLAPGEHVFVHGAAGGVGAAVVQVALDAGARVTATARRPEQLHWLAGLGQRVSAVDTSEALPSPREVDVHWDCTGGIPLDRAVAALNRLGRVVVTARRTHDPLDTGALYLRDASVVGFVLSHATTADLAWAAAQVNRLLAAGLHMPFVQTLRLSEAAEAHRLLEAHRTHSKLVLTAP